jgi:hypothetical protein
MLQFDGLKIFELDCLNKIIIFTCYHRWLKKNSYTDDRLTDPKIKNLSCVNLVFLIIIIKVMYG